LSNVLTFDRRMLLAWLLVAAALAIPSYGPAPLISSALTRTGAFTMAEKPKTDYRSKLGPIPPDNFDNDLPYNPDVDVSDYDELAKKLDAELAKSKPKK
jgi:hypothetical protein